MSPRPLASYGTWGAEGLADALARASGRPRATPEEVEAVRRVIRDEAAQERHNAETARLVAARREETKRALIAVRWAGAPVLDMPEDEEPGDDAGEEDDALAGLAMLLLALALGLLALASAAWIGWALAAHLGELWQAAEAAAERGAM